MAVKTPYCSLLRGSPLHCTTLNSVFKKRAGAGLTESIQHSLFGFSSKKFPSSKMNGFCIPQKFSLDFLLLGHKLDMNIPDQQESKC